MDSEKLFEEIADLLRASKDSENDLTVGSVIASATPSEMNLVYNKVEPARKVAQELRRLFPVYAQVAESFTGTTLILVFPRKD